MAAEADSPQRKPPWRERFVPVLLWGLPGHWLAVHRKLKELIGPNPAFRLLDVGGRQSHYTAALPCNVHIIDLPCESDLQRELNLGLSEDLMNEIKTRRSNVRSIRLEDVTKTTYGDATFDGTVAVEVIEHIPDDSLFVSQVNRVLRPGGWLLVTTPNGELIPCTNPDHQRHYTGAELKTKLAECFDEVHLSYIVTLDGLSIAGGKSWIKHKRAKRRPRLRAPFILACALLANLRDVLVSAPPQRAAHLFALARKAAPPPRMQIPPSSRP